jgi:hypothetical protein
LIDLGFRALKSDLDGQRHESEQSPDHDRGGRS